MAHAALAATRAQMVNILTGLGYIADQQFNKSAADQADKRNLDRLAYAAVCGADLPVPSVAPDTFTILIVVYFERSDPLDSDDAIKALRLQLLDATKYTGVEIAPTVVVVDHPTVIYATDAATRHSFNIFCYS